MGKVDVSDLGTVQETMFIPLWARAVEQERPAPILRDPRAVELTQSIDYDFSRFREASKIVQPAACVLAMVIDNWTKRFLQENPDGVVVEIGAGLDTRFERLDNGRVHWFDLDLPDAIALRRRFFRETERRRFLPASALETDWIGAVKELNRPVFFVAEAVLMYFVEADVKRLFRIIADSLPGSLFAFDACGKLAQKNSRKLDAVKMTNAEFRWGIDDAREVEAWDPRFRYLEEDTVLNYHRDRFPAAIRFATWLVPAWRRAFTINLIKLGAS